jgi:hypothetical protein
MGMITAFCDRKGRIEFVRGDGRNIPEGMLGIVEGPAKEVRELIGVTARHAYDNKTLLVPGIPEAESDTAAYDALVGFCDWLKKRNHPELSVY